MLCSYGIKKLAVSWIYQIPCSQVARKVEEMNHRGEAFKYCSHLFIDPEFSHPSAQKQQVCRLLLSAERLKIQARLGYSCHVPQSTGLTCDRSNGDACENTDSQTRDQSSEWP